MKTETIKLYSHSAAMEAAAQAALQPTAAQAIAAKVDRLGVLHAALADMKREADQLRAELEDAGLDSIEGHLYRVNFATVAGRTLTDWEAIAKRLKASPQIIRAYTKTGEGSTRMTVKARQTH
jgi:histidinol-phosphate/aromatic aminotransferase/cobyric acid decarboxylase-like protein